MKVFYEEISVRGVRRWTDPCTGKRRQETKKFSQTISPFNRDKEGNIKTRSEILEEISKKRDEWESKAPRKEGA